MKRTILILFMLTNLTVDAQTWTNPITMNGEWYLYGIGDPYILKYNGTYYLYCSTKDNNTGVKCWSTKDFITWSNAITCSTDPVTKTAYAPEVVYWNGTFYMYTSPGGGGHYVLSSNSPTGPFTAITGNLGKSIDGSVFINDDGNWYFYHADGNGILGCPMSSPTAIGSDVNLNARMGNSWTEGPCVIKRNANYYLLYTGNHVISKGYRVDYAKNTTGPINSFSPQNVQNPILLKSEGSFVGLGHGSAFRGPDLDSYYFCYHNLAGDYGVGPYRRFNYDRIAWNGDKLLLLGPTTWAQESPSQPDLVDYFNRTEPGSNWEMPNGGNWTVQNEEMLVQDISNDETETFYKALYSTTSSSNYTAEFTVKEEQRSNNLARIGAVFGYTDESNYGIAVFHSISNQLEINFKMDNVWGNARLITLPTGYKYNFWHSIRIEKYGTTYKFFVDGMQKASISSTLGGGKVGYISSWSQADFGYIALSNRVNGSGIFDVFKPVPGKIEAVHYNSGGEGVGYYDTSAGNSGGKYIRDDNVDISDCSEGGFAISDNKTGEWYKYNVNVKAAGTYNLGVRYATSASDSKIRVWQGDTDLTGIISLPSTSSLTNWQVYTIKELNLNAGFQTLKFEIVNGNFDLYNFQFEEADNSIITKTDNFSSGFSSDWNYSDGSWTIESGQAKVSGYGKKTFGNTAWSDYIVQTDITYTDNLNSGLIFRVNNPALGGAGNDAAMGTDFYQGYFVTLGANSVVLGKQNYSWTLLATAQGAYYLNTKYTIKVLATGANIKVFVNDMNTPKIDYTDPNPFINGKVGLRSFNSTVYFDNFSITTSYDGSSTKVEKLSANDNIKIYPNPVSDRLIINGLEQPEKYECSVYNLDGQMILKSPLTQKNELNVRSLASSQYLLVLRNRITTEQISYSFSKK